MITPTQLSTHCMIINTIKMKDDQLKIHQSVNKSHACEVQVKVLIKFYLTYIYIYIYIYVCVCQLLIKMYRFNVMCFMHGSPIVWNTNSH